MECFDSCKRKRRVVSLMNTTPYVRRAMFGHPQFRHLLFPPESYEYVEAENYRKEKGIISYKCALGVELNENELRILDILGKRRRKLEEEKEKFVYFCNINKIPTEVYERYLSLVDLNERGDEIPFAEDSILFSPSYILTLQQSYYVVEIEDIYTLFFPYILNSNNTHIEILNSKIHVLIQYLLERKECACIITHMQSTAECLRKIFGGIVAEKVHHIPMGVLPIQDDKLCASYQTKLGKDIRIFFSCSWHQGNFEIRGGLDVLEAFDIVCQKYENLHLVMKCTLPSVMPNKYREIINKYKNKKIHIISEKLSDDDMDNLMRHMDIYLLPAARIHVISILGAMAAGIPVITSDGWGINEYIKADENGIIVEGRYGKTSWVDNDGILREDYSVLYRGDEEFAHKLAERIERLIMDDSFRLKITRNAIKDIRENYSIEKYNENLKNVFDKVFNALTFPSL